MGFFSSLDIEGYDRQYTDKQLVSRAAEYFRPYTLQLLMVTFLLLVIALATAATPLLVSRGIDALDENLTTYDIVLLCGIVLLAGIIIWITNWGRRRIVVRMVADIVLALRIDAFQETSEHDLSFFDEFPSGKIVSRISSDTHEFGQTVILITDLFAQIVQAVILGAVLVSINLRLSLYLFAFLPVLFLAALGFRRLARKVTRTGMRAMANVNSTIKETVSGIVVAKNFRQEASIFDEFDQANKQSYSVNVQRGLVLSSVFPALNVLGGIATAILLYIGGINAALGIISTGAWFLFLISLDRFFFPVLNLSAFWAQIQSGLSASERVFALMDVESNVVQNDNLNVPDLRGEIMFQHVYFQYIDDESIFNDFDLHVYPGETIALVGHTGAGKSSIAKLIARYYEFQGGQILIDGMDIRSFDLYSYRSQLGIVSQTPFLFSGTVVDNISYTCPSKEVYSLIQELAYKIGEGEWLGTLANGLDTEVGERGARLSMGQRQLVSLMRVIIQKPAIFILDEATASIDPFTEWQIQQALDMIFADTTSILIAHRLSTVKAANRIIVLEHGMIVEEGSHEYLLAKSGEYANLYNTYFRHQSLTYIEEAKQLTFKE
ncbi:ABC transporter ATP-binding protein [Chloroflexota bacterium]